jgi:hypothetical protein
MSILTGQPCEPPCWYGITPGVTKRDEAKDLLQKNPYVRSGTLKEYSESGSTTWTGATSADGFNELYVSGNVARLLSLTTTFSLTLKQIVDRYGAPEKVLAFYAMFTEDMTRSFQANLYYSSRGLILSFHTQVPTVRGRFLILADILVDTVHYLPKGHLSEQFRAAQEFLPANEVGEDAQSRLQDWHGFGTYDFPADPLRP